MRDEPWNDDDHEPTPGRPRRLRIMHLTMLMLGLMLVSKLTEVATGANALLAVSSAVAAEEASGDAAEKPAPADAVADAKTDAPAKSDEKKADAKKDAKKDGDGKDKPKEEMTLGAGKRSVKEIEAMKAAQKQLSPYTPTELDLLQNLTKRRDELDAREAELALKSKILEATEKRINDKLGEMKTLEAELSRVVTQYQQQQDGEIKSLVKIYESMKPGDAAAIFNEMDMPILLEVIDTMSERKVAPILAGMDPRRARDVTQELAEMRRGRAALNRAAQTQAAPAAASN